MGEVEGEFEGEAEIVIGDADVDAEADALADDEGEAELDVVTVIETVIEGVDVYVGDAVVDAEAPTESEAVAVADALLVGVSVKLGSVHSVPGPAGFPLQSTVISIVYWHVEVSAVLVMAVVPPHDSTTYELRVSPPGHVPELPTRYSCWYHAYPEVQPGAGAISRESPA